MAERQTRAEPADANHALSLGAARASLVNRLGRHSRTLAQARYRASVRLTCLYQTGVQIELVGDRPSLLALADALQGGQQLSVPLQTVPAAPWDGALDHLAVDATSGPVAIHHDGRTVTFEGGAGQLAQLGRNIRWFADQAGSSDSGDHIHLEHIPDADHYIGADALPLVVTLSKQSP